MKKIPDLVKQRIHAEETHDSEYVMIFNTTIPSISNTLDKLLLHSILHYSYIQTKYNGRGERMSNIFITYVEPLLNGTNHPEFIQEWKLNLDTAAYEKKIDSDVYKSSA